MFQERKVSAVTVSGSVAWAHRPEDTQADYCKASDMIYFQVLAQLLSHGLASLSCGIADPEEQEGVDNLDIASETKDDSWADAPRMCA